MKVKIKQIKSSIGAKKNQRDTIKALGLKKIGKTKLSNLISMILSLM